VTCVRRGGPVTCSQCALGAPAGIGGALRFGASSTSRTIHRIVGCSATRQEFASHLRPFRGWRLG
jgi:hypothetical protein